MGCVQQAHVVCAGAAGAHVSAHDVSLQLLRVKLLALSVIAHKPLVTVGDVKTTIQRTLQKKALVDKWSVSEAKYLCCLQ